MTIPFSRVATLCATAALVFGAAVSEAQMSVSPIILQMAPDGAAQTKSVQVTNTGGQPISVRFYAGDFEQDERGDNQYAELGTLPSSCAKRLHVYPDGAAILPGETQAVRVEMEPGAESCWSAVFVETAGVSVGGTLIRQRIAAKVYGVRPDARVEGEVTRVVMRGGPGEQKLAVTFRNLGDAPLRPQGTLEIHAFTGEVVAESGIDAFSVLPGRERTVELPLARVATQGEYLAVPVLDFGGKYLAGGQVAFQVGSGAVKLAGTPDAVPRQAGGPARPK